MRLAAGGSGPEVRWSAAAAGCWFGAAGVFLMHNFIVLNDISAPYIYLYFCSIYILLDRTFVFICVHSAMYIFSKSV